MRRLTWLLFLLLIAVALYGYDDVSTPTAPEPSPALLPLLPEVPEPERAVGALEDVYRQSRAATVRVESRCRLPLGMTGTPLDVGSGFFVSPDGDLLTAYHVVRRQRLGEGRGCVLDYFAVAEDDVEYSLELVGFDAISDVALLRADVPAAVPFLPLAAELPAVGAPVVVIGNSRGEFLGDRAGEISRLGVSSGRPEFASGTMELTAAVAPGDSGGPVIGSDGTVVGVVSYISYDPSVMAADGESTLGRLLGREDLPGYASYAVPVLAGSERFVELAGGVRRDVPVIGFEVAFEYDPRDPRAPPLGSRPGVVVGRVDPDGPGGKAGLRGYRERTLSGLEGGTATQVEGDVIVAVDGHPTASFQRLLEIVRSRDVGDVVTLSVQRNDSTVEVELQLAGYRQVFE